MNHREHMQGLEASEPITVGGVEYTGTYLALMVRMNPNLVGPESAETPQLIAEIGRIVARAKREHVVAESAYRVWRDSTVHMLTNDLEAAKAAGFECAANPGVDSRGKPKPAKTPATTAAEAYVRTLPDYTRHQATIAEREEAWSTMHAVYEAANARTWAARTASDESQRVGDDLVARSRLTPNKSDNPKSRDLSDVAAMKTVSPPVARRRPPPPPPRRK